MSIGAKYDRVVRASLLESERYCTLPSDTHKLAFRDLLHMADDFGNLEHNSYALGRFLMACTNAPDQQACEEIIDRLITADLLRHYSVQGRNYLHIPRFKSDRRYRSRLFPISPWCDEALLSDIEVKRGWPAGGQNDPTKRLLSNSVIESIQQLTKKSAADLPQTSRRTAADLPRGVGVGVKKEKTKPLRKSVRKVGEYTQDFDHFWSAYPRKASKQDAFDAWEKIAPDADMLQAMLKAIEAQRRSQDWLKDDGQWIPYPATWLRGARWLDETSTESVSLFRGIR